jgi:prefoldin subunit 5
VSTAIWASVGFLCLVVVAGTAWVGYQLVQTWRQLRRLPDGILGQVTEVTHGVADVERRIATVERQVTELQAQVESLSVSLARVRVLTGAVREVRSAVSAARSFIPSK